VISSLLKLAAILCSAVLLVSFAAFARDEAGHGSTETVAKIASADASENLRTPPVNVNAASPTPRTERMRERRHGTVREAIDDVNDVLVSPFQGVASGSIWAQRGVSALLALLLFGAGLGFAGRYAASRGV
jgi:hypothetical protein